MRGSPGFQQISASKGHSRTCVEKKAVFLVQHTDGYAWMTTRRQERAIYFRTQMLDAAGRRDREKMAGIVQRYLIWL
jgi:hypothetical protein